MGADASVRVTVETPDVVTVRPKVTVIEEPVRTVRVRISSSTADG